MEISMPVIWLIAAIAFGIFELVTTNLVSIWFVIGAVIAMLTSLIGLPLWGQIAVFVISSGIVLFFVRPLATKYVNSKTIKTNIDALVGRITVAKTDIDNFKMSGRVDMDGTTWLAKSVDDSVIATGEEIKVVKVEGAKLIVEKIS
jgi:membrane protein implicated in regulation of membrane protease activity